VAAAVTDGLTGDGISMSVQAYTGFASFDYVMTVHGKELRQ